MNERYPDSGITNDSESINRLEEDRELVKDLEEIVDRSPEWLRNSTDIEELLESRKRAVMERAKQESAAARAARRRR